MRGQAIWRSSQRLSPFGAQSIAGRYYTTQPEISEIERCPPATCSCGEMPSGLDIKTEGAMTMPIYSRHIIVHTGTSAWPSKIDGPDPIDSELTRPARYLKELLGPRGKYKNPERPTLVTYSDQVPHKTDGLSAFLWPHRRVVQGIGSGQADWEEIVGKHITEPISQSRKLANEATMSGDDTTTVPVVPQVLICGHGERDQRCGILGPLLLAEFRKHLHSATEPSAQTKGRLHAETALISHIGGHVWAGNVLIYFPGQYHTRSDHGADKERMHPLSGAGVWYGRVQPKHVEGIIEQTLQKGVIIKELLRGINWPMETT